MKTEQKLEIYRELFGSLPDAPVGKELVGFERKLIEAGDLILTNKDHTIWHKVVSVHGRLDRSSIVAIFQDTHRPDGTPLSIDPLPEVEGYRVEYAGLGNVGAKKIDGYAFLNLTDNKPKWRMNIHNPDAVHNASHNHYARLYKIAQPTTLADLVGKHGQNNVWLHTSSEGAFAALVDFRDGRIHYVDGKMIECLIKYNYRWSNDPFTKYADAKEFIPE